MLECSQSESSSVHLGVCEATTISLTDSWYYMATKSLGIRPSQHISHKQTKATQSQRLHRDPPPQHMQRRQHKSKRQKRKPAANVISSVSICPKSIVSYGNRRLVLVVPRMFPRCCSMAATEESNTTHVQSLMKSVIRFMLLRSFLQLSPVDLALVLISMSCE